MAAFSQYDQLGAGPQAEDSPFRNRLLIAMPSLQESSFSKSVIYVCAHSAQGAMGIVVNQKLRDVDFRELAGQLRLPPPASEPPGIEPAVHFGGPVETERGFVLHSTDFIRADTVRINDSICITATIDILREIALGKGPRQSIFALGYAGWGPGQLEAEIGMNTWLTAPATSDLIFGPDIARKWDKALTSLGIDALSLSSETGHA